MTQPKLLSIDVASSRVWVEKGEQAGITSTVRLMGFGLPQYPLQLTNSPSIFSSGLSLFASLAPGAAVTQDGRSGEDANVSFSTPGVYEFAAQANPDLQSEIVRVLALGPGVFDFTIINGRSNYCWMSLVGPGPGGLTGYWLEDPFPYIAFLQVGQECTLSAFYPTGFGTPLAIAMPLAQYLLFVFWTAPWKNYTDASNLVGGARVDLTQGQIKPGLRYTIDVGGNSVSVVPKTGGAGAGAAVASFSVLARQSMPAAVRPLLGDPLLSVARVARALPGLTLTLPRNFLSAEESLALLPLTKVGSILRA